MKGLLLLTTSMLGPIIKTFKNRRKKNDDFDLMADVDDQRAHHFADPEDFVSFDHSR